MDQIPSDQGCENGCEAALLSGKLDMLPSSEWGKNEAAQVAEWNAWQQGGLRSQRYGAFN